MDDDRDDLEETEEEDGLGVPVMKHVAGLPYRAAHTAFHSHLHRCARCFRAHSLEQPCYRYCTEGRRLVHEVQEAIEAQHDLADLN